MNVAVQGYNQYSIFFISITTLAPTYNYYMSDKNTPSLTENLEATE